MLKKYFAFLKEFETREIIQQDSLISVKWIPSPESYTTYVEIVLEPHVTPDYFKRFFTVLRTEVKNITPECTGIRELCVEEGKYPTTVETFAFPFVSERYAVLTAYKNLDYSGTPGNHIYVASCRGNEDKACDEYLGKGFTKSRVLQETFLAVYHCMRKPDGRIVMAWLVEINRKGIPEWIFLKLQLLKYASLFKGIYKVLAAQHE